MTGAEPRITDEDIAERRRAPDTPVEWSVRWTDGFVQAGTSFTEAGARRRAEQLGATVVYRHVGPWLTAPDHV